MAERIAYLISQYPTISHSFIFREIRELRKLNLQIEVISIRRPDRASAQLTPDELVEEQKAYYVRADAGNWLAAHLRTLFTRPSLYSRGLLLAIRTAKGRIPELFRHLRFFGEAVVAGQWVRRRSIGHVHTHFASATTLFLECIFQIPVSMTIHGSGEFIDPDGFCMAEKVRASKLLIGISRYGCSQIMRFSDPVDWDKVAMARLGINPDEFQVSQTPRGPVFEVICVGRLVPVKAYRFLIRAFAMLLSRQLQVKLTIIGGGPELAGLTGFAQQLDIAEHVEFTGPLPNEKVRERVRHAGCFALASFAEGVPVVLMEAMALGVACVATRVTGVPELITDGVEGILVPPADAEALANAIGRLIENDAFRSELAANGRSKVLAEYDLRVNAQELRALLATVR